MNTADRNLEIVALKRNIRCQLNAAARDGRLEGFDILVVLASLLAEMVARVNDDDTREQIVKEMITQFPFFVTLEREMPPGGVTWQ